MKILVINCGSSSLKYQLIDMNGEKVLAKGLVERIGIDGSVLKHEKEGLDKQVITADIKDHEIALQMVVDALMNSEYGAIKNLEEIDAVGHRVVHGGETFSKSTLITEKVKEGIKDCSELAPLHNPANLLGINACEKLLPNAKQVAVFDTAFHQTMPEENYIYALPYEYYEKYKVRRYGFHGTSHLYVSDRAADILNKDKKDLNVITCHLGNGASLACIKNGKCIDTSMGLTPLEGLVMGTRCGDIDPAIIPFIMEKENLSIDDVNNVMNKKSGVLGVSGVSSDFRDIEDAAWNKNNERANLALNVFYNRIKKYIGAYMIQLGRLDAIVFTAGVGENSKETRIKVLKGMEDFGIKLDLEKAGSRGKEEIISTADSKVKIIVIPTNEELMIARDTKALVEGK